MCSIVGCAGPIAELPASLRNEHHEFMSCLFTMAELRGRDAAGFWVWRNNHYVEEKRALPAEDLIERSVRWKSLRYSPGSLYLMHTRAATEGDPNNNANNHPHKGDHTVLIHNGCLWGHEALVTQHNIEMETECDSEVLLRLAEQRDDMKEGLEHMYDTTHCSHGTDSIACAFVDRRQPDKILLSRNSGNPCFIYRSEKFNCTFFCSTEAIFERSLQMLYKNTSLNNIGATKAISIDTHVLYNLSETGYTTKEKLDVTTSYHSPPPQYHDSYGTSNDNLDETERSDEYITTLMGKEVRSIDIRGTMKLLKSTTEEDTEEIVLEWEENEEMTNSGTYSSLTDKNTILDMPISVENSIVEFLEETMKVTT